MLCDSLMYNFLGSFHFLVLHDMEEEKEEMDRGCVLYIAAECVEQRL